MRGPLKDRYPPMAVDLADPRRRLAVLIDGSAHTRLLQPVVHGRGTGGQTQLSTAAGAHHGPSRIHHTALFTHVLPALYAFGVPVLLRVFGYELLPEWGRLIAGHDDDEDYASTAESGEESGGGSTTRTGHVNESASAAHGRSVSTDVTSSRDGSMQRRRAGSTIIKSVLTLPEMPGCCPSWVAGSGAGAGAGAHAATDSSRKAYALPGSETTSCAEASKQVGEEAVCRGRGVRHHAMVEVEYFRVERFIPIPMQMEADAQHIHDFRAQNKVEGVCYVCTETDRAVYERVMTQQQQQQQPTGAELSSLPESLQNQLRAASMDSSSVFFNQYLFDELGLVKEINVDGRLGDGQ